MELRTLLREDMEREHDYLRDQEVGSDEYNASMKRLGELEVKFFDLLKLELESADKKKQIAEDRKDRRTKNIIEVVKTASGILMPVVGLVGIMAFEKEQTFTSALRDYVKYFLPKKTI